MLWISLLIYLLPCCIRQLVELWQCFSTVWMNSCLFILMDDSFISTLPCNSWSYNNLAYIATCIKSLWLRCMTYAQINVSHHYESSVTWRATYITSLLTSYVRKMFLPYLGRHLSGKKKRTLYPELISWLAHIIPTISWSWAFKKDSFIFYQKHF